MAWACTWGIWWGCGYWWWYLNAVSVSVTQVTNSAWDWNVWWETISVSVWNKTVWALWGFNCCWRICYQWDTSSLSVSFKSIRTLYLDSIWETISFSITVLSIWAFYRRRKGWGNLDTISISITSISIFANYRNESCNTVSKSIWLETCWTDWWCWLCFWYSTNSCWNPDTSTFSVWSETTGAWYIWYYIWFTFSFAIWYISTWAWRSLWKYFSDNCDW